MNTRRTELSFDAYYFEKKEQNLSMKETFEHITNINLWGSNESQSGVGSSKKETNILNDSLGSLLKEMNIRTLTDAPCGDFNWLSNLDISHITYLGVDILENTIEQLQEKYKDAENMQFMCFDISKDVLPKSDLILCRDCLFHFSYEDIRHSIKKFKESGSTYLLTTTFPNTVTNENITTGDWQPLNLEAKPFLFPKPELTILEGCQQNNGLYADKSLGLWKLDQL